MKKSFDLIVVIPIGPYCKIGFIADTISSIQYYVRSTCKIILADDSNSGVGRVVADQFKNVEVLTTYEPMGKLCGLYITLSLAFRYALDKYDFKALLRIDTDALVIGKAPEKEALELFTSNPHIGMAGQYPLDYQGLPWDTYWPGRQLWKITHTPFFFKKPYTHWLVLKHYLRARRRHYKRGESVFGGACFFSVACLKQLQRKGLLPHLGFRTLELEEDHLFSLLVKSIGYELGSLSGAGMPVGCAWLGLPAPPLELEERDKKIIHSTRYWKEMTEEDIRAWFSEKRTAISDNSLVTQ